MTGSCLPVRRGAAFSSNSFFKLYDDAREIGGRERLRIERRQRSGKRFLPARGYETGEFCRRSVLREFEKLGGRGNLKVVIAKQEGAGLAFPRLGGQGAIVDVALAIEPFRRRVM